MSRPYSESYPVNLITEDDAPVDNFPSEKLQRLLTEPLYSSWSGPSEGRTFLAAANVGVFYLMRAPAIVPDVLLSLDVEVSDDWWKKEHRSYFLWEFGKPPDVVIEIVSNQEGGEDSEKLQKYARMRVPFYVIYDPQLLIMPEALTVYRLEDYTYQRQAVQQLATIGLGLTLWQGSFEGKQDTWLRWTDAQGQLVPTGKERADAERQHAQEEFKRAEEERKRAEVEYERAEVERQRAEQERQRAEQAENSLQQEKERAERMAELLRQLGHDPDQV